MVCLLFDIDIVIVCIFDTFHIAFHFLHQFVELWLNMLSGFVNVIVQQTSGEIFVDLFNFSGRWFACSSSSSWNGTGRNVVENFVLLYELRMKIVPSLDKSLEISIFSGAFSDNAVDSAFFGVLIGSAWIDCTVNWLFSVDNGGLLSRGARILSKWKEIYISN